MGVALICLYFFVSSCVLAIWYVVYQVSFCYDSAILERKHNMKKMKYSLVASGLLLLTGCASVISGTSQEVQVKVVDADNTIVKHATCMVTNGSSDYEFDVNPASIMVNKNAPLVIKCRAKGYKQKGASFGKNFDTTTLANVLFWPGFLIDGMSGSMHKYPSHIIVEMQKS